jgi:hypothetical protein
MTYHFHFSLQAERLMKKLRISSNIQVPDILLAQLVSFLTGI